MPGPRPARSSSRSGGNPPLGADTSRAFSAVTDGWDGGDNGGGDDGGDGGGRAQSLTPMLALAGKAMMLVAAKIHLPAPVHGKPPPMLYFMEWMARIVNSLRKHCCGRYGELYTAGSCSISVAMVWT